ncbi:hypothetical protein [Streptomyces sp. NBC_00370]|uniref:hypothetical protein n=1 Tax=Streptomyces sp. NBC_00370 TaxID=2975728 RepID=UPI002E26F8B3
MKTKRRRGRTTLIVVAAAVLGVVAGTATGYAVQADRAPKALPPLNQPGLAYPAKSLPEGKEPEPLTVAHDAGLKTSGDLRKLLISKPRGATKVEGSEDGWMALDTYAGHFADPESLITSLAPSFRRAVNVSWNEGKNREVVVTLVQFKPSAFQDAAGYALDQQSYMPGATAAGNNGSVIEGTDDGRYWVYDNPRHQSRNRARAVAWRGDIMMEIDIFDRGTIRESAIRTLAERQMERL